MTCQVISGCTSLPCSKFKTKTHLNNIIFRLCQKEKLKSIFDIVYINILMKVLISKSLIQLYPVYLFIYLKILLFLQKDKVLSFFLAQLRKRLNHEICVTCKSPSRSLHSLSSYLNKPDEQLHIRNVSIVIVITSLITLESLHC